MALQIAWRKLIRVSQQTILESSSGDYSHLFLQMEQFDKISRNLSEILYI